jgi:hypothetical protein
MLSLLGCDSDDNGFNSKPKVEGDPSDPVLQAFDPFLAQAEHYSVELINIPMYAMDSVFQHPDFPDDMSRPGFRLAPDVVLAIDSVVLEFHDRSDHWYMTIIREFGEMETIRIEIVDSVQFWQDGAPVQWPDSAKLSGFRCGFEHSISLSGERFWEDRQKIVMTGNPYLQDAVTFNGSGYLKIVDLYSSDEVGQDVCSATVSVSTAFSDLTLVTGEWYGVSPCPPSGILSLSGWFNIACTDTSASFNHYWHIREVYSGDQIAITAENSTTRWVYTVPGCRGMGQLVHGF